MKLKEVGGNMGQFVIAENEDHQKSLCLREGAALTPHRLFKVSVSLMRESEELASRDVYVLAEDAHGAESQAQCHVRTEAHAEEVPFGIRGWSNCQF